MRLGRASNKFGSVLGFHYICTLTICPDGGIGRRAGLKHQWSDPCRFDPGSGYFTKHSDRLTISGQSVLFCSSLPLLYRRPREVGFRVVTTFRNEKILLVNMLIACLLCIKDRGLC